jgi:tetratricopeptide (TPR) repeat protein
MSGLGASLVGGLLFLAFNGAYLTAFPAASISYYVQVVLHAAAGVAVIVAALAWAASRRPRAASLAGATLAIGAVAAALGLAVLWFGATRPYRWLLDAHVVSSVIAVLLTVVTAARWLRGTQAAALRPAFWAAVALTALAAAIATPLAITRDSRLQSTYTIRNPASPPLTMDGEGGGPSNVFFPSSIRTETGGTVPASFFMSSQQCERCHKEIYDEWTSSAHRFSSFNNQWYRKSIEYMQDTVGTKPSRWCAGCHDHAMIFAGTWDTPAKDQIERPEAHAGLGCVSCHSMVHVGSTMGQGDFVMEYPALHELASSDNKMLAYLHDKLIELAPRPHREAFIKPFHREQTAEFCSSCHKVHLDVPVNGYRWFRGFNDYDNWQASGVSGQGARSFYYPPAPMSCADCHMPRVPSNDPSAKDGKVRSHRFIAANTALPYVNHDQKQLELTQAFLRSGQVSIDVFALVRGAGATSSAVAGPTGEPTLSSTFAVGEESASFGAGRATTSAPTEVVAPIDGGGAFVRRGESVRVDVVVRTRNVGHFFPGGTVDAFDVWVELEAVDERGQVLLHSGYVEDAGRGPVDASAHMYRSLMLDERGNPINKRNAWATRSVAYVRLIPPGAADTVHYRLAIPEHAGDRITLKARVNHRKFAWWTNQWSYAGERHPNQPSPAVAPGYDEGKWVFTGDTSKVSGQRKEIPVLPVTVMAEATATLNVGAPGAPPATPPAVQTLRGRWNDYGIGLLLQGDLKAAELAFLKVTELDPAYADGWVNVARVRLQEGNLTDAEEALRKALTLSPDLAKTHFFLGSVLKSQGRYDEAIAHMRRAAALYPRDRVVRNQLGRVLFLQRKFTEAVAEFQRVLEVDPEDLQAHYNLMLAYQGLGNEQVADRERKLYERFKADEASQAITGDYRQLHPHDNNERQAVHEHAHFPPAPMRSAPGGAEAREASSPARNQTRPVPSHMTGGAQ